jgi:hypothetical protein
MKLKCKLSDQLFQKILVKQSLKSPCHSLVIQKVLIVFFKAVKKIFVSRDYPFIHISRGLIAVFHTVESGREKKV